MKPPNNQQQTTVKLAKSNKKRRVLETTISYCGYCSKLVPAKIVVEEDKVFLEKTHCSEEKWLIENDIDYFNSAIRPFIVDKKLLLGMSRIEARQKLNKTSKCLLLYITKRCDLCCPICYHRFHYNPAKERFSIEDILNIVKDYKNGLIVLSGGEPTLREDLPEIIKLIKKSGNQVELYTNGLKLLDINYVKKLKKSGLKTICFSFDGFDDNVYQRLRGKNLLEKKIKILNNLEKVGIGVWLVVVIGKDINENQITPILEFARRHTNLIRGVKFNVLYDPILKDNYTISDIRKIIEKENGINIKWFIEEKRLRYNLYKIVKKIFTPLSNRFLYLLQENHQYITFKNGEWSSLIPIKRFEEINKILEKGLKKKSRVSSVLHLCHAIIKIPKSLTFRLLYYYLMNGLNFPKIYTNSRLPSTIDLYVSEIRPDHILDVRRLGCVGVDGIFEMGNLE